jgi:hypothetical protein
MVNLAAFFFIKKRVEKDAKSAITKGLLIICKLVVSKHCVYTQSEMDTLHSRIHTQDVIA